jgi:hypothetical protein
MYQSLLVPDTAKPSDGSIVPSLESIADRIERGSSGSWALLLNYRPSQVVERCGLSWLIEMACKEMNETLRAWTVVSHVLKSQGVRLQPDDVDPELVCSVLCAMDDMQKETLPATNVNNNSNNNNNSSNSNTNTSTTTKDAQSSERDRSHDGALVLAMIQCLERLIMWTSPVPLFAPPAAAASTVNDKSSSDGSSSTAAGVRRIARTEYLQQLRDADPFYSFYGKSGPSLRSFSKAPLIHESIQVVEPHVKLTPFEQLASALEKGQPDESSVDILYVHLLKRGMLDALTLALLRCMYAALPSTGTTPSLSVSAPLKPLVLMHCSFCLLFLFRRWKRSSFSIPMEHFGYLIVESKGILLILKFLANDPPITDEKELYYEHYKEHFLTTIALLEVLYRLCKYHPLRVETLVYFKVHTALRRILVMHSCLTPSGASSSREKVVEHWCVRLIKLVAKAMGRKFRAVSSNMRMVSLVWHAGLNDLGDNWLVDSVSSGSGGVTNASAMAETRARELVDRWVSQLHPAPQAIKVVDMPEFDVDEFIREEMQSY